MPVSDSPGRYHTACIRPPAVNVHAHHAMAPKPAQETTPRLRDG